MIGRLVFVAALCCYLVVLGPFTASLAQRPVVVKLGALPDAELLRLFSGDQRYLVGHYAVVKVLFYYGTLVEKFKQKIYLKPEYQNMFATLKTASRLDPYNADVYYFTEAAFTWELGKIAEVNEMLDYGMKYRTWDYQLPFFAGFNAAYFRKDFASASAYLKKAAELSRNPLMTNLAARYFHESGRNEMGLRFIEYMERRTTDRKLVQLYEMRKQALIGALTIEKAVLEYTRRFGKPPAKVAELVEKGVLKTLPKDPYGGEFYLDKGVVLSTSKLALPPPPRQQRNAAPESQEK